MEETKFEKAYNLNVSEKTEKKEGLTYLSWAWAWAEFKKIYPDATYQVEMFGDYSNLPFVYDDKLGYMVFTSVKADGVTHSMWLPVMNGANKAMRSEPYVYQTKYGEKTVEAATMFDVNKTLMRCLTKNLAMFGLGLYIYAGEDLPEVEAENKIQENKPQEIKYETIKEPVNTAKDYFKPKDEPIVPSKKFVFTPKSSAGAKMMQGMNATAKEIVSEGKPVDEIDVDGIPF